HRTKLFSTVMSDAEVDQPSGSKQRSPNFPAIALPAAIDRARIIYERERRHATKPAVIFGHWGFKPKSSGAIQTLAALRRFGLVDTDTAGNVALSDRALRILIEADESPAKTKALTEAATTPTLYA